jgi:hypothetical protein
MGMNKIDPTCARVCSGCASKDEADAWALDQGFTVSHGLCPNCLDKALRAVDNYGKVSMKATRLRRAQLVGVSVNEMHRRDHEVSLKAVALAKGDA